MEPAVPSAPTIPATDPVLAEPWLADTDDVAAALGTDLADGLPPEEAARRLTTYGPNELLGEPPVPMWRRVLAQMRDPLVVLLLVAVAVSLGAWVVEGAEGVPFDAVVIAVIVLLNAVLGVVQERRAEDAVAALAQMSAPTASVVRGGRQERVPARDVVPGDLLVLAEGDTVPADARLASVASLQVAEASLTGKAKNEVLGGKDGSVLDMLSKAGPDAAKLSARLVRSAPSEVNPDEGKAKVLVYGITTLERPGQPGVDETRGFDVSMVKDGDTWKAENLLGLEGIAYADAGQAGNGQAPAPAPGGGN